MLINLFKKVSLVYFIVKHVLKGRISVRWMNQSFLLLLTNRLSPFCVNDNKCFVIDFHLIILIVSWICLPFHYRKTKHVQWMYFIYFVSLLSKLFFGSIDFLMLKLTKTFITNFSSWIFVNNRNKKYYHFLCLFSLFLFFTKQKSIIQRKKMLNQIIKMDWIRLH